MYPISIKCFVNNDNSKIKLFRGANLSNDMIDCLKYSKKKIIKFN